MLQQTGTVFFLIERWADGRAESIVIFLSFEKNESESFFITDVRDDFRYAFW